MSVFARMSPWGTPKICKQKTCRPEPAYVDMSQHLLRGRRLPLKVYTEIDDADITPAPQEEARKHQLNNTGYAQGSSSTTAEPAHPLKVWLRNHVSDVLSRSSTSSAKEAANKTAPVEASSSSKELSMGLDSSTSTGCISTMGIPKEANRSCTNLAIWRSAAGRGFFSAQRALMTAAAVSGELPGGLLKEKPYCAGT